MMSRQTVAFVGRLDRRGRHGWSPIDRRAEVLNRILGKVLLLAVDENIIKELRINAVFDKTCKHDSGSKRGRSRL